MPLFEIEHAPTGIKVVVEGDRPPTTDDAAKIFASILQERRQQQEPAKEPGPVLKAIQRGTEVLAKPFEAATSAVQAGYEKLMGISPEAYHLLGGGEITMARPQPPVETPVGLMAPQELRAKAAPYAPIYQPSSSLEPVTQAGLPRPAPPPEQMTVPQTSEPFVGLPKLEIPKEMPALGVYEKLLLKPLGLIPGADVVARPFIGKESLKKLTRIESTDPVFGAVSRAAINNALGLVEFFESPMGLMVQVGSMVAPLPVSLGFLGTMSSHLVEGAKQTTANWDQLSPSQKAEAIVNLAFNSLFVGSIGKHAVSRVTEAVRKPIENAKVLRMAAEEAEKSAVLPEPEAKVETVETPRETIPGGVVRLQPTIRPGPVGAQVVGPTPGFLKSAEEVIQSRAARPPAEPPERTQVFEPAGEVPQETFGQLPGTEGQYEIIGKVSGAEKMKPPEVVPVKRVGQPRPKTPAEQAPTKTYETQPLLGETRTIELVPTAPGFTKTAEDILRERSKRTSETMPIQPMSPELTFGQTAGVVPSYETAEPTMITGARVALPTHLPTAEPKPGFLRTAEEKVMERYLRYPETVSYQPAVPRVSLGGTLQKPLIGGREIIWEPPPIQQVRRVGQPRTIDEARAEMEAALKETLERQRVEESVEPRTEAEYATTQRQVKEGREPEHPRVPQGGNLPANAPEVREGEGRPPSGGGGVERGRAEPETPTPTPAERPSTAKPVAEVKGEQPVAAPVNVAEMSLDELKTAQENAAARVEAQQRKLRDAKTPEEQARARRELSEAEDWERELGMGLPQAVVNQAIKEGRPFHASLVEGDKSFKVPPNYERRGDMYVPKTEPTSPQTVTPSPQALGIVPKPFAELHALLAKKLGPDPVAWLQQRGWIPGPQPAKRTVLPTTGKEIPPLPPWSELKEAVVGARYSERMPVVSRLMGPTRAAGAAASEVDKAFLAAQVSDEIAAARGNYIANKYGAIEAWFKPDPKTGKLRPEIESALRKAYAIAKAEAPPDVQAEFKPIDDLLSTHKPGEFVSDIAEMHLKHPNEVQLPKELSDLIRSYAQDIYELVRYLAEEENVAEAKRIHQVNLESIKKYGTPTHFGRPSRLTEPEPLAGRPTMQIPTRTPGPFRYRTHATAFEGASMGIRYESSPRVTMASEVRRLYRTAVAERLINDPSLHGMTVAEYKKQLYRATFPELKLLEEAVEGATSPEARKSAESDYRKALANIRKDHPEVVDRIESEAEFGPPGWGRSTKVPQLSGRFFPQAMLRRIERWAVQESPKIVEVLKRLSLESKLAQLTGDISWTAVQGSAGLAYAISRGHPEWYLKAAAFGIKRAFMDPDYVRDLWAAEPDFQALSREMAEAGFPIGERVEVYEAAKSGGVLTKVPYAGEALTRLGASFSAGMDYMRLLIWRAVRESYKDSQGRIDAMRGLEDVWTLLGQARPEMRGVSRGMQDAEIIAWTAAKYYRAGIDMMAALAEQGATGQMFRRAIFSLIGGTYAMAYLWRIAHGDRHEDIIKDLAKGNTDITVQTPWGGARFGLSHITLGLTKLMLQIIDWEAQGKSLTGDLGRENPIIAFLLSKSGPIPSAISEARTGETFMGEKTTLGEITAKRFMPIMLQQVSYGMRRQEEPGILALEAAGSAAGIRVYPEPYRAAIRRIADTLAIKENGRHFDDLPIEKQAFIYHRALLSEDAPKKPLPTVRDSRLLQQRIDERKQQLHEAIDPEITAWLDRRGLSVGGWDPVVTVSHRSGQHTVSVDLPMTLEQQQMYFEALIPVANEMLKKLKNPAMEMLRPDRRQELVSQAMGKAREQARAKFVAEWNRTRPK